MAKLTVIPIPDSPIDSFDSGRQASELVMQQVRDAHAELVAWINKIGNKLPKEINTEQEAADYIGAVTRVLHPEGTPASKTGIRGAHLKSDPALVAPTPKSKARSKARSKPKAKARKLKSRKSRRR